MAPGGGAPTGARVCDPQRAECGTGENFSSGARRDAALRVTDPRSATALLTILWSDLGVFGVGTERSWEASTSNV